MDKNSKKIEIISGDGKNLNISEVSTHLSTLKPKNKDEKKQEIVIPQSKKSECKNNKK